VVLVAEAVLAYQAMPEEAWVGSEVIQAEDTINVLRQ
jgi:hypothetical protein